MLINYSNIPKVVSRGNQMVWMVSTDVPKNFNIKNLTQGFVIESKRNIYRMQMDKFGTFPHFAVAYYNQNTGELIRSAMTKKGFDKLTAKLNSISSEFSLESEIAVSPAMLNAAKDILNRKITLTPYESLFHTPAEDNENLNRLNHFLQLAMPLYDEGKRIDFKQMSQETGREEQILQDLWLQVTKNIKK